MTDVDKLFEVLSRSKFRSGFHLDASMLGYIRNKGLDTILAHARDFVTKRLADAEPKNDGKQTPYYGHPVFIAQHATATCCRKCLQKIHHIPKHKHLTDTEIDYIVNIIKRWLTQNLREDRQNQN